MAATSASGELERAAALIGKVADNEETAFRRTLDKGLRLLEKEMDRSSDKALDPDFVADLYDTYGFPIDLTRVIAEENQRVVDEEAAHALADAGCEEITCNVDGPKVVMETAPRPIKRNRTSA